MRGKPAGDGIKQFHHTGKLDLGQGDGWPVAWIDGIEAGTLGTVPGDKGLFRFYYLKVTRGCCTFVAKLKEENGQPLQVDADSICFETYRIKKGKLLPLLHGAEAFFNHRIRDFTSIQQLQS